MDKNIPAADNSFRGEDPRVIEIDDPSERAYWCKSLGISEAQLVDLLRSVGSSAQKVKDALAFAKSGS